MSERPMNGPDSTAARVALWRALHVQVDSLPHVFEDEVGLRLAAPAEDWRRRPDMDPEFTRPFRASIVARSAPGGDSWRPQASILRERLSLPARVSACISPGMLSLPRCARSRRSPPAPRWP